MNIYNGLSIDYAKELDDFLAEVSADVIRQYVLEDGIEKNDPNDNRVEMMMRFSERFFLAFQSVVELNEAKGASAIVTWQEHQHEAFAAHASDYQSSYQQVSHLAEPPFFVTNWAMCYLVDTALHAHSISTVKQYSELTPDLKKKLEYTLRFGDNLLQSFQSRVLVMG
jgi:DNA polymerase III alpha subunit